MGILAAQLSEMPEMQEPNLLIEVSENEESGRRAADVMYDDGKRTHVAYVALYVTVSRPR